MNLHRFTQKAQQAAFEAQRLANTYQHGEIMPEHLLLALLQQQNGVVLELTTRIGVSRADLAEELNRLIAAYAENGETCTLPCLSQPITQALDRAEEEARLMQDQCISTEHILLAMIDNKNIGALLARHQITRDTVLSELRHIRRSRLEPRPTRHRTREPGRRNWHHSHTGDIPGCGDP